jgi:CheY-like chemotaxis protein
MEDTNKKRLYKILLADDDPDDRDLFEEAAGVLSQDISMTMAKDGVQLMEILLSHTPLPDMIFLDLNMPKKNGKECLHEISLHKRLRNVPIIIYTTSLNPIDIDDTYTAGAFRFFKKPNSFEELKDILSKAFDAVRSNGSKSKDSFILNAR